MPKSYFDSPVGSPVEVRAKPEVWSQHSKIRRQRPTYLRHPARGLRLPPATSGGGQIVWKGPDILYVSSFICHLIHGTLVSGIRHLVSHSGNPNHQEKSKIKWHESFLLQYQGTAYTIHLLWPLFRPSPPSPLPPACISTRRRVRLSNLSSHRFPPGPPVIFVRSWYLIAPAARFRAQRVRLKLGRNKELGGPWQGSGVAGPPSTLEDATAAQAVELPHLVGIFLQRLLHRGEDRPREILVGGVAAHVAGPGGAACLLACSGCGRGALEKLTPWQSHRRRRWRCGWRGRRDRGGGAAWRR